MTDDDAPPPVFRRIPRAARWVGGIALLIVVALAGLWIERRPIARSYVDDLLAQRGVPARYRIAEIGFGRQRLTDVVIGDAARPDLVADWIEVDTAVGLSGASVTGLRAGRVRMRGAIVGGRMTLGAIDRLLPAPSGAPFALPAIRLDVADGRMRLATPAGPVGLSLAGRGRLDDGFAGTLAATAPLLTAGGCAMRDATAYLAVRIADKAPRLRGPIRLGNVACGDATVRTAVATIDAALDPRLDRWRGTAHLAAAEVRHPAIWLRQTAGEIGFDGTAQQTGGTLALTAGPAAAAGASAARVRVAGRYQFGSRGLFDGQLAVVHASLPARWRDRLAGFARSGAGTPVAALIVHAAPALAAAGRDVAAIATLTAVETAAGWGVTVAALDSRSAGGARFRLAGGDGIGIGPGRAIRFDGTATLGGGGLPDGSIAVRQAAAGEALTGVARFAPYAAGGARLALAPVTFRATPDGATRFTTSATLSGPLGDGRVDGATLPIDGFWDGGGRLVINPGCARGGFDRLVIAGLTLDRATLGLCPVGRALVTLDAGRLGSGARIAAPRLTGRLGGTPLTLAAAGSELRFGDGGFRVTGLAARLGAGPQPSRLDLGVLTGRIAGGAVAGSYTGGAGRIGAVPLLLSEAAGDWRLANGTLTLGSALMVADAAPAPRFNPLASRDVRLTLANGLIRADGTLVGPVSGLKVAQVAIRHRLADASGVADLKVPGITFGERLQPTALTRLTLGVIAEVRGTVSGSGQIRWSQRGVTSDGDFGTDGVDLAAAFGPVTGLKGQVHFTDLLALQSAPGQVATVTTINPGVAIADGTIRYQLLAGPMVQVEDARWPFSGGVLALEPTLLDYSRETDKRMTFRVTGLDAGKFLQGFDYKNLDATGTFDGTLPMVFDATGGRITEGHLTARGGGTLAYVGEISEENLGFWGNIAFGALRSLRYRSLDLKLYGPLAGNVVTEARFGGVAQGEGAKSNFLIRRLARLPFVFNVKITAPFRALIDSARSFYDPNILIRRNLPALLEQEGGQPVQPPASDPMPQEKPD